MIRPLGSFPRCTLEGQACIGGQMGLSWVSARLQARVLQAAWGEICVDGDLVI